MRCASRCWPRSAQMRPPGEEVILGILSLIVWALILIVSVKYVIILLRANNNGEGGTLALMALAQRAVRGRGAGGDRARHDQRRSVLRRCDDHAGAVGAVGGRGPGSRDAGAARLCRPTGGGDPVRPVRGAVAGHGARRVVLRSDHFGLVLRARRCRRLARGAKPNRARRLQSGSRRELSPQPRRNRTGDSWSGVSGRDRLRGALRRSRPFRSRDRSARPGLPWHFPR